MAKNAISPTRNENFPQWYQEVIRQADVASHGSARGCMIIHPWGYALWEHMQRVLDAKFKEKGVDNAYFPLFIPLSSLEKEATHVKGFATECAIVTHSKLTRKGDKLIPDSPLEEPYIVRPTSEMVIGESFSQWINSYRDLPLKINQWANIVRWEMRPRLFLRTCEILWQEGHTAHATAQQAEESSVEMLEVYRSFIEETLALPAIPGVKSKAETFPGADKTFTIEMIMQDGKALQACTSHYLGQNFSKASNIMFDNEQGEREYAYTSSWGITTRMIGALIMVHGDDNGLVLPPKIAHSQVIILPFIKDDEDVVLQECARLQDVLKSLHYAGAPVRVHTDTKKRPGARWEWIKKGAPLILEVGKRDIDKGTYPLYCRFDGSKTILNTLEEIPSLLENIQSKMFTNACAVRDAHEKILTTKEELDRFCKGGEGFAYIPCADDPAIEESLQKEYGITHRCWPQAHADTKGTCLFSGKEECSIALFAKAY